MKITIAQLNPTIGDIDRNLSLAKKAIKKALLDKADLIVFPELFITGYPPLDLLERKDFLERVLKAIEKLTVFSKEIKGLGIIIGAPILRFNSALLIFGGKIVFQQNKRLLPTYDVFDELRYFDPGQDARVVKFKDEILGISICEDMWKPGPIERLAEKGATLIINISASPFYADKEKIRYEIIRNHAKKHRVPFVFVNQVGGNDELIFDGGSMVIDGKGEVIAVLPAFKEKTQTVDLDRLNKVPYAPKEKIESIYWALILGIRDYMRKCGFKKAIIGLSGGIDSAVTASLAAAALGNKNVIGLSMPGPYSSKGSVEDAKKLAGNLGIKLKTVPISKIYHSYLGSLKSDIGAKEASVAKENIQARIRGNVLMAFSNKYGYLVLSTGNKSELAVGYCTIYGDMSGGLAVISDVPKTMVYELAGCINRNSEIVPQEIINKAPSAELRPNQKDQDTLPPYDVLDEIIRCYIDEGCSLDDIEARGHDRKIAKWTINAINKNEFKRRQAAPGLKVTSKAFGMGRKIPIAAKF
ncbi:MAG: NAD+ synthase [Candidatus Nealsonbacteria bacterium]|nr:NAD+ synthase [Candidatus Nealsonbacteria bacterium]